MKEILACFQKTLDDGHFSRAETKALRQLLKEYAPNQRQLAILRRKLFALGTSALEVHKSRDVLLWLEGSTKLILEASRVDPVSSQAYFSPGKDCLNAINGELSRARSTVDICVFTITDNRISNEILKAEQRGVQVRIITDNDKSEDEGSDVELLVEAGIAVKMDRTRHHMHHKYAIIDGQTLISGSYNWTRSAAAFNAENIVITNDRSLIKRFTTEFEALWKKSKKCE